MSTAVKAEEAEFEHVNSFPPDISQAAFDLMPAGVVRGSQYITDVKWSHLSRPR